MKKSELREIIREEIQRIGEARMLPKRFKKPFDIVTVRGRDPENYFISQTLLNDGFFVISHKFKPPTNLEVGKTKSKDYDSFKKLFQKLKASKRFMDTLWEVFRLYGKTKDPYDVDGRKEAEPHEFEKWMNDEIKDLEKLAKKEKLYDKMQSLVDGYEKK